MDHYDGQESVFWKLAQRSNALLFFKTLPLFHTHSSLDYSQAVDVGSLKGVQAPTIRILVCCNYLNSSYSDSYSLSFK